MVHIVKKFSFLSPQEQGIGYCGYVTHIHSHSQSNQLQVQYS